MTYKHRDDLQCHEIKIRLTETAFNAVDALASHERTQKAVLAREIFMAEVYRRLDELGANDKPVTAAYEGRK